jgi:isopenicillin-N epimerase
MVSPLRSEFLLDPAVVFLNHGSFGACPRPVFEAYQAWQRELERQPVEFLGRRVTALLAEARAALAAYVGARAADLVYFPNPTTAVNMVARSLDLRPGDEVLATDHEYGAMDRTWAFLCRQAGATYVRQPIPVPVTTHPDLVERVWAGVTPRTRVIFLSHITSPTALTFPVAEVCRRARTAGLFTIVDGAHAPGQIPLDLAALGADVYTGACHKWLCAPKGSAFLHVRAEAQARLRPLVVSWGWGEEGLPARETLGDTAFVRAHEWQGTRDVAAFLATPAAIQFQAERDWEAVRRGCRTLASETRRRIDALTGLDPICPDSPEWFTQFVAARLPDTVDGPALKARLWEEFRIEVPLFRWSEHTLIRVSFQAYNSREDADLLIEALRKCLPR